MAAAAVRPPMRSASAALLRAAAPKPGPERPPLGVSPASAGAAGYPDPEAYYSGLLASLARDRHARHPLDASPHRAHPARACGVLHAQVLRLGDALVDLYCRSGRAADAWRALGCGLGAEASGPEAASSVLSCRHA